MSPVEDRKTTQLRTEKIRSELHIRVRDATTKGTTGEYTVRQDIADLPFFKKPDIDIVRLIGETFKPELVRLAQTDPTAEVSDEQPTGALGPGNLTPSQLLFGANHPEVDRTVVGILALKWLVSGAYRTFTAHQDDDEIPLDESSFKALQTMFIEELQNGEEVYTVIVAIMTNDLGKDDLLWKETQALLPNTDQKPNHDRILYLAAQHEQVPLLLSFADSSPYPASLMKGLHLGASLNVAQLLQAENVPASLLAVRNVGMDGHTLKLKFFEILLDIAGAQGHIDSRCCRALTKTLYQSLFAARAALLRMAEGTLSARNAYDLVLDRRAETLSQCGFTSLNVEEKIDRALLRLMCMARAASHNIAKIVEEAFVSLRESEFNLLVKGLSVDGIDDGDAIIPYYAPSLFAIAFRHLKTKWQSDPTFYPIPIIKAILRLLSRVYSEWLSTNGGSGRVVECDLHFVRNILNREFIDKPCVLDGVKLDGKYGEPLDATRIGKSDV